MDKENASSSPAISTSLMTFPENYLHYSFYIVSCFLFNVRMKLFHSGRECMWAQYSHLPSTTSLKFLSSKIPTLWKFMLRDKLNQHVYSLYSFMLTWAQWDGGYLPSRPYSSSFFHLCTSSWPVVTCFYQVEIPGTSVYIGLYNA